MTQQNKKKKEYFPFKMKELERKPVLTFLNKVREILAEKPKGKAPGFFVDSEDIAHLKDFFTHLPLEKDEDIYLESELWGALQQAYDFSSTCLPSEDFLSEDDDDLFMDFMDKMVSEGDKSFVTKLPEP